MNQNTLRAVTAILLCAVLFLGSTNADHLKYESYEMPALSFIIDNGTGVLENPGDVVSNASGHVYVSSTDGHTVYVFDSEGNLEFSFGGQGNAELGEFDNPTGMAIDESTDVFFSDGLEGGDLDAWNIAESDDGEVMVSSSIKRSGTYSLGINSTDDSSAYVCGNVEFEYPYTLNFWIYMPSSSAPRRMMMSTTRAESVEDGEILMRINEENNSLDTRNGTSTETNVVSLSTGTWINIRADMFNQTHWNLFVDDDYEGTYKRANNITPTDVCFGDSSSETGGGNMYLDDVNVSRGKRVYVADTKNHRIQAFDFDGSHPYQIGHRSIESTAEGTFEYPVGLAIDSEGRIYVADSDNNRIQVLNRNSSVHLVFDGSDSDDGEMNLPEGVAVHEDRIYVADTGNHKIRVFDMDGEQLFSFGEQGSSEGNFSYPSDVVADSEDRVYVSDTMNHRIQMFYTDGEFVLSFGSLGEENDEFAEPRGIWADSNWLYVTDTDSLGRINDRVKVYNITTFPRILSIEPANDTIFPPSTENFSINLTTSESVSCRYTDESGRSFAEMPNEFDSVDGIQHSALITNVSDGATYDLYIACFDYASIAETGISHRTYRTATMEVRINEFVANSSNDWIEIHNNGETVVDMNGWILTHSVDPSENYSIAGTIGRAVFRLFYENGTGIDLDESVDEILLLDSEFSVIDNYSYNIMNLCGGNFTVLPENYSIGRAIEGSDEWEIFNSSSATEGYSNAGFVSVNLSLAQGWNLISAPYSLN